MKTKDQTCPRCGCGDTYINGVDETPSFENVAGPGGGDHFPEGTVDQIGYRCCAECGLPWAEKVQSRQVWLAVCRRCAEMDGREWDEASHEAALDELLKVQPGLFGECQKPDFQLGQRVRSARNSSDITKLKMTWRAVVTKISRPGRATVSRDGFVYLTLGSWEGTDAEPTTRQLPQHESRVGRTANEDQRSVAPLRQRVGRNVRKALPESNKGTVV